MELGLEFKPVESYEQAYELEKSCYDESEAASLEKIKYRLEAAPELFLGAFLHNQMVGLIMGTATTETHITHQSMSQHEPDGKCLCIHSVAVAKDFRRKGIALEMLAQYLSSKKKFNNCSIIVHEYLVPLYEKAGFKVIGISEIVHGPDPWLEMNFEF